VIQGLPQEQQAWAVGLRLQGAQGRLGEGGPGDDLTRPQRVFHQCQREARGCSPGQESRRQFAEPVGAHVDGQGCSRSQEGQGFPGGFRMMAFEKDETPGDAALGEGHPCRCGRGLGGANPGDDLEGQPGVCQDPGLLAAAPEDERIAALEPDHPLTRASQPYQEGVNRLLGDALPAAAFAHGDDPGLGWIKGLEGRIQQGICQDHLGRLESPQASEGQIVRMSGTGSDQGDGGWKGIICVVHRIPPRGFEALGWGYTSPPSSSARGRCGDGTGS